MAIIKIGELLKLRGLDINKRIKLVRHKDARQKQFINGVEVEGNPYDWYRNDKDKFIAYQSEQHRDVFKNVDYIVSFIGENGTIARFIGIYKIEGPDNERNTNKYCYKMTEVEGFDELKERIIIDWGPSTISWHQWLNDKNDKEIIEITPGFDHIFPGYEKIALTLAQLKNIILEKEYPEWKKMLSAVNCIYIITDRKTGKNYIGSTYGKEGIWGRWKEYAKTGGHGNNVTLQKLYDQDNNYPNNFSWSILETLSITISSYEAINIEKCYKQKLGTLAFGLNNN